MDIERARATVLDRDDLQRRGIGERALRRGLDDKAILRLHAGRFAMAGDLAGMYSEQRHLVNVIAVTEKMRGTSAAASLTSAAVLHDLPLFRLTPKRVHVSGARTRGVVRGSQRWDAKKEPERTGIAYHETEVPAEDIVERFGIRCTSLERTVYDMIRIATPEAALAVADAALRQVAFNERDGYYDLADAEDWRESLNRRIGVHRGAKGIAQARRIATLMDGRAQLPGESVSRLYLLDLGFATPRLQVPIPGPDGDTFHVDFGLEDVNAWGEFDGIGKYVDPAMVDGREPLDVLRAEKRREDWIRALTKRIIARWGMPQLSSARTLGLHLLERYGLTPPR